jgi:hypothetical protein
MRSTLFRRLAVAASVLGMAGIARADLILSATDNATVQPSGPRTGANGKIFFNAEAVSNGTFASYGVVDFATTGISAPVAAGWLLTLKLTEDNAAFTAPTSLNFYLSTDTTTNIQPGTSPLKYDTTAAPEGIGNQLSPKFLLGSGQFTTSGNVKSGQVDTYSFALTASAAAYIDTQLGSGPLRIIVTPTSQTGSATWAGFSDTSFTGPRLLLAVPEPGPLYLGMVGSALSLGVWAVRRRREFRPASA